MSHKQENLITLSALGLAGQFDDYFASKHIFEKILIFEDLVADTRRELGDVFDVMGLAKEHLPLALEALKEDSQKGTFGPMGNDHMKFDEKVFDDADRIMKEMGIPISTKMTIEEFRKLIY